MPMPIPHPPTRLPYSHRADHPSPPPPGCTDKELNKDELKQLLYDEVMSFHSLL